MQAAPIINNTGGSHFVGPAKNPTAPANSNAAPAKNQHAVAYDLRPSPITAASLHGPPIGSKILRIRRLALCTLIRRAACLGRECDEVQGCRCDDEPRIGNPISTATSYFTRIFNPWTTPREP